MKNSDFIHEPGNLNIITSEFINNFNLSASIEWFSLISLISHVLTIRDGFAFGSYQQH